MIFRSEEAKTGTENNSIYNTVSLNLMLFIRIGPWNIKMMSAEHLRQLIHSILVFPKHIFGFRAVEVVWSINWTELKEAVVLDTFCSQTYLKRWWYLGTFAMKKGYVYPHIQFCASILAHYVSNLDSVNDWFHLFVSTLSMIWYWAIYVN